MLDLYIASSVSITIVPLPPFAQVWCLAPVAGSTKEEKPKISHVFQEMDGVTMKDRVMCWVDKFKLYGVVGMCTAFVGGLLTLAITGKALELNRLVGYLHAVFVDIEYYIPHTECCYCMSFHS